MSGCCDCGGSRGQAGSPWGPVDNSENVRREILTKLWHAAKARGDDPWTAIGEKKPRVRRYSRPLTQTESSIRMHRAMRDDMREAMRGMFSSMPEQWDALFAKVPEE